MNAPCLPVTRYPSESPPTAGATSDGLGRRPTLRILGIRGLPARHGGFESFAENFALHLVSKGWDVIVYCQEPDVDRISEDTWCGIRRVLVPASLTSIGSVIFDWRSISHAAQHNNVCLTLGYNTAVFTWRLRMAGVRNVINMDGIEWARGKWGPVSKLWFYLNDWAGCWLADRLVADHPAIHALLATRGVRDRITMIPYGSVELLDADPAPLTGLGLKPNDFFVVIARPEPENSIREIVIGFQEAGVRQRLVLLGHYQPDNRYHQEVKTLAGPQVIFPGAIYDARTIAALRVHATAYLHGHRVGGTNPSLVEALGAGSAVVAHDNRFNRWVAGPGALYFSTPQDCALRIREIAEDPAVRARARAASRVRWREQFTLDLVHEQYERLLLEYAIPS